MATHKERKRQTIKNICESSVINCTFGKKNYISEQFCKSFTRD